MSVPRPPNTSHLLINESPLFVLPSLAVHVGLNEAIFLQQVHYWLQGNAGKEYEGRHWIYSTRDQWRRQFPFWSTDAIKRVVQSLRKQGVLLTNADLNKSRMDRTLWYTIDYDALNQLANSPHERADSPDGVAEAPDDEAATPDASGNDAHSNQETTQEITQEELWAQLRLLGIPDRPALLMLLKRGPYNSNIETLELARRRLSAKRHEA